MVHKILLVDDDLETLKLLGLALHRRGYQVEGAQSGVEALDKIRRERPHLVILDLMLPGMNGYQVCQQIRQMPETAHLPVIMLTALDKLSEKVDGFASGADDYLVKPVPLEELLARVKALLTRAGYTAVAPPLPARPHSLAFIGVKGGVGTTTLAVNVAVVAAEAGRSTILVDLHPHGGAVAGQLGRYPRKTLSNLLEQEPECITAEQVRGCLFSHDAGFQVLPGPLGPGAQAHELTVGHVDVVLRQLGPAAEVLILDLEPRLSPAVQAALEQADRVVLISEPDALALRMTTAWLNALEAQGVGGNMVGVVMVNRSGAATTYPKTEIEQTLHTDLLALITPAPELCLWANKTGIPLLLQPRDNPIDLQLRVLAQQLLQRRANRPAPAR